MTRDTKKEYRQRLKQGIPNPVCSIDGRRLKSNESRSRGICSKCFKRTPGEVIKTALRVRTLRQSRKGKMKSREDI